jgi:hypothetical protein
MEHGLQLLGFWNCPSPVIQEITRRFSNWIGFRPQVEGCRVPVAACSFQITTPWEIPGVRYSETTCDSDMPCDWMKLRIENFVG